MRKSLDYLNMKWGLGIGDWGLGIGDWPIPNPLRIGPFCKVKFYIKIIIYCILNKLYFKMQVFLI